MEHNLALLKFQIENLDYRFRNYGLLTKALTHSIDNHEIDKNFPLNNRTSKRLGVVGEAVLKLVASEYVIRSSENLEDDQGNWTIRRAELLKVDKQEEVGKRFFHPSKICGLISEYTRLVRINKGNWSNPSFEVPHANFVKAIFGAVFIDSGGSRVGTEICFKLFLKLWKPFLPKNQKLKNLQELFPPPESEVLKYWELKGIYNSEFVGKLFSRLKLKMKKLQFRSKYIFLEAIIQKSFYKLNELGIDSKLWEKRLPHYERLEFLGDAVLDVIIAEYLWREYPHYDFSNLSIQKTKLIGREYQNKIFKKLGLKSFVKVDPNEIWRGYDDIIESLIAAVYLTFGSERATEFVFQHWNISSTAKATDSVELQYKIGYKFANEEKLSRSLTHVSAIEEHLVNEAPQEDSQYFIGLGRAMVELVATEYAFQVLKLSARAGAVEALRNYLCGKSVMPQISEYLNLKDLVKVNSNLKDGSTPFKRYEAFVFSLIGAIFMEMEPNQAFNKLQEIFYRLWNPYLKGVPQRTFIECFVPNSPTAYEELEKRMDKENYELFQSFKSCLNISPYGYKFKNDTLPIQALIPRYFKTFASNPSIGDTDRFFSVALTAFKCGDMLCLDKLEMDLILQAVEAEQKTWLIKLKVAMLGAVFVEMMTRKGGGIKDWFSFYKALDKTRIFTSAKLDEKSPTKATYFESALPTNEATVKPTSLQTNAITGQILSSAETGSLQRKVTSGIDNLNYRVESANECANISWDKKLTKQPIESVRKSEEEYSEPSVISHRYSIPEIQPVPKHSSHSHMQSDNIRKPVGNSSGFSFQDMIAELVLNEIKIHTELLKSYPKLKGNFESFPSYDESLSRCSLETLQIRFDCSVQSYCRLKDLNEKFQTQLKKDRLIAYRVLNEIQTHINLLKSHPTLYECLALPSNYIHMYESLVNCNIETLEIRFDCSADSLNRLKSLNEKFQSQIELEKRWNNASRQLEEMRMLRFESNSNKPITIQNNTSSRSKYPSTFELTSRTTNACISSSKSKYVPESSRENQFPKYSSITAATTNNEETYISQTPSSRQRLRNIQGEPLKANTGWSYDNAQSERHQSAPINYNNVTTATNSTETSNLGTIFEIFSGVLILCLCFYYYMFLR